MPTILSKSVAPSFNTGYLSPRVGPGSFVASTRPELSQDAQQQLAQRIFNTTYSENRGIGYIHGIANTVAGSVIDFGDTVLSSVTPMDRGSLWDLVGDAGAVGADLQDYYRRNQSRIETISGIGGAVATAYVGGELLLPRIAAGLAESTAISSSRLWQMGASWNAATRSRMIASQMEAAADGEMFHIWKSVAGRAFTRNRFLKGVGKAAFEESAIAATMHTNEAVWSDDLSTNLLFAGLGLGVGGAVATYGARYEMRRIANTPEMIQARGDAIDPQGFTSMRENQPLSDAIEKMKDIKGKESANFTVMMLEARQATPANASRELESRFDKLRPQVEEQAINSLQKISTKGIVGIPGSRFNVDAKEAGSAGKHIMNTAHNDPTLLFGADSIGVIPAKHPDSKHTALFIALDSRQQLTEDLIKSGIPEDIRRGRELNNQQPLLLVNNSLLPAKNTDAYAFSDFNPNQVRILPAKSTKELTVTTETGKNIRINEGFELKSNGRKINISDLPINERFEVREGLIQIFRRLHRAGEPHIVQSNPNWFQLDSAVEYEKRGGLVDWSKNGVAKNSDEARLASLRMKAEAIKDGDLGTYWDRLKYNLPLPSSFERQYDSMGDSLRIVLDAAKQGAGLDELGRLRNATLESSGFELRQNMAPLDGDFFNFNIDDAGKWKTPVLMFFDSALVNKPLDNITIAQGLAELKAERIHILTGGRQEVGMVPTLTKQVITSPNFQVSSSLRGLADDQITGIGHPVAQASGELLTREFRYRDSRGMLGLLKTREDVNRATDTYLSELAKPLSAVQKQLTAGTAASSRTLVNQFFSNAAGWDIAEAVDLDNGFFGFKLANTGKNSARLKRMVLSDELLFNPRTGKPMVVDSLGLSYITEFDRAASAILADKNRLRRALGLAPIREKRFYVPPPDTRNKFVGFTFDEENNTVPGGGIVASTKAEFDRLRANKLEELPAGYTFRTREQVAETADLWERAAMDWIDPGVGFAPARGQEGALASDLVNPNAIGDSLDWVKRQVEQIGTNTLRVLYDSQLGIARARGAVERTTQGIDANFPIRTIWDEYEATVLGKNLADTQRSLSGVPMRAIESRIDHALAATWPALKWMAPSHLASWVGDVLDRSGVKKPTRIKTFNQLTDELAGYSPYKNAQDYIDQNFKVYRPPEIREIAQKLNRMSAALVLRYFEIPMAAMNMLGIITTLPSILRSGRAPVSGIYAAGTQKIGAIDAMKIMMQSTRDLTRMSKHADWDFMVKNGDTTQQVADFNKQLSLVNDQRAFKRVFFGDKSVEAKNILKIRSLKDVKNIVQNKGVDGLISALTDTTENWSRTWAHFAGLRLADLQGITGLEARHSFARDIANAAIANYNPMNRPELYQSAFGSMFGLFLSWMQSYNQRLFRWMETGDYASIGRQMGMQAGLFGVASLPGFNLVQSGLLKAGVLETEDGDEATLMDHIYARFGPEAGAAFAHGGLSELGVALYTRGDMNYRDLTLDPTRLLASAGVIRQVVTAVHEAEQSLFKSNSIDDNGRLLEIIARNSPNRVLKGILWQLATGGQEIDSVGQIVSENRNFYETALRMAGVRSTFQQGKVEAFYASKQMKAREAARMEVLRDETRSLIRNDPHWEDKIQEIFQKHIDSGGRPEHFRTWIRDQIRAATSPRDVNALVRAMRNPKNNLDVWRYDAYAPE